MSVSSSSRCRRVLPQVETGKLRALAITSAARSQLVANVPTVAEMGFPGFEVLAWYALFAPRETPKPVVARLSAAIEKIVQLPDIRDKMIQLGAEPRYMSPEQLTAFVAVESPKWGQLIRRVGRGDRLGAFSGNVDPGFPLKMRPLNKSKALHASRRAFAALLPIALRAAGTMERHRRGGGAVRAAALAERHRSGRRCRGHGEADLVRRHRPQPHRGGRGRFAAPGGDRRPG